MRKLTALLLAAILICGLLGTAVFAQGDPRSEDIVILYTNDVHTYIDGVLSYDVIAGLKAELSKQYRHVLLVDAGDHIQGTAFGSMDRGETIIALMNAAGYDVATLGNHEFDYGMEGCIAVRDWAEYPYVSCNFYHEIQGERGNNVLDSFKLFDCGREKVAIIGVTTPESFTKSTPAYFQDGEGRYIYGISGGENGEALRADLQKAIDGAVAAGATKVIALGHLGDDPASRPWTSEQTIAGVTGLDAFIDGHSHSKVEGKVVQDQAGNDVLLTQTGEYFGAIGMMRISADEITTDLIGYAPVMDTDGQTVLGYRLQSELYTGETLVSDAGVKAMLDNWIGQIDAQLGTVIGCTDVIFDNYDGDGNRLVRSQGTNTGDFSADALYYLFDSMGMDVDVAVMNGGGIRNKAITGEISYLTCKNIHTFGNVACLQSVTGQQLLDMLEWGAKDVGYAENGSLLHVSGITYRVNTAIPNTTTADDKGVWISGPTAGYRVWDVKVYNKDTGTWDPLDLNARYHLAGYNYTLRDLGGGFAMLDGAVNVLDYVMEDYLVLANYVRAFENGRVGAANSPLSQKYPGFTVDYSSVHGSGRIGISAEETEPLPPTGDRIQMLCVVLPILILCAGALVISNRKILC